MNITTRPRSKRRSRTTRGGFSLIELLVVLVILSLLGGIVGPRLLKHLGRAKADTAALQIDDLAAAVDIYMLETGAYPTSEQGLNALIEAPAEVTNWNGPYLRKPKIPVDPWGNSYHYNFPGEHGDYDIVSYGADNAPGGEKDARDISSWD